MYSGFLVNHGEGYLPLKNVLRFGRNYMEKTHKDMCEVTILYYKSI